MVTFAMRDHQGQQSAFSCRVQVFHTGAESPCSSQLLWIHQWTKNDQSVSYLPEHTL